MEKAFTETLEEFIEAFLKFFYGFLRTNWRMVRLPAITAERLVRQSTFDAFEFTLPYTYFALSFLLNFLLLRTLFKVLHQGGRIVETFLPTLLQTLSNPLQLDPLTAFVLMVLKAIPLFGVMTLACYILEKRFRFTEPLSHTTVQIFCYCFGFFWNILTACLLVLMGLANIWARYRQGPEAESLLAALYGLLGIIAILALLVCYRFTRQVFQSLLSQDTTPEKHLLSPHTFAQILFSLGLSAGLAVEYGMTILEISLQIGNQVG